MLRIALHLVIHLAWTLAAMILLVVALASLANAAPLSAAIVMQDRAVLRSTPRESGQQQAVLWQGETVEVRGERLDYLQIYDHRRERAGFVRASQVRRVELAPEAAPADVLGGPDGIDVLDALATMADRLARQASSASPRSKAAGEALAAHLD